LGTWLIWLTVIRAVEIGSLIPWSALHTAGTAIGVQFAVMWVPPGLVMLVCKALAEEVFGRLTQIPQQPWGISRRLATALVTVWLPLALAIIGAMALTEMHFRVGVAWLVAAGAVRVLTLRMMRSGEDLTPHAISIGELRDRVFALARQAGVSLEQLYVVPTGKTPQANAFAVKGGNVFITEHLLRNLTRREVDGVAAHELAHLKYRHPQWMTGLFFAALFVPDWLLQLFVPFWWHWSWMQYLPIGVLSALGLLYFVSRRFEYQTDSYAAWLTGDPEGLITGLVKVHRLNLLPMKWDVGKRAWLPIRRRR
jgi:Zn-dependent protease with chaperone function